MKLFDWLVFTPEHSVQCRVWLLLQRKAKTASASQLAFIMSDGFTKLLVKAKKLEKKLTFECINALHGYNPKEIGDEKDSFHITITKHFNTAKKN